MVLARGEMNLSNFSQWVFSKCWVAGLYHLVTLFVIRSTRPGSLTKGYS